MQNDRFCWEEPKDRFDVRPQTARQRSECRIHIAVFFAGVLAFLLLPSPAPPHSSPEQIRAPICSGRLWCVAEMVDWTMRVDCRLWWPTQLLRRKPAPTLLCGWFFSSSSGSVDVVVANLVPLPSTPPFVFQDDIIMRLRSANEVLPSSLRECSRYCIVGYGDAGINHDDRMKGNACFVNDSSCNVSLQNGRTAADGLIGLCNCEMGASGSYRLDKFEKEFLQSAYNSGNWIRLTSCSMEVSSTCLSWIPKFDHMHLKGDIIRNCVLHVITYEQPSFGSHHFSLTSWCNFDQVNASLKKPRWVPELYEERALAQMALVFLALNCSTAAKMAFESSPPLVHYSKFRLLQRLVAVLVASVFCLYYIGFQLCLGLMGYASKTFFFMVLAKIFPFTWKILQIRSCQIIHCPILLQEHIIRSDSNIEYAHKVSLRRHSVLSTIVLDILLGNIFGFFLLFYEETIYFWMSELVHEITSNILRSGCVWLMGVPAGFKLNNELATVFGMFSLNVIQIWSTIWVLLNLLYCNIIRSLAISGIIFGATVPAAFIIDTVKLATLHLSVLHWLFTYLYALQIQALASLWRLFRGRKWNPLRQRLDSYKYTVEQHVVGSLLFTPTLLLLPTTSVFYIFFSIMNISSTFTCMIIEVVISMVYAIPCAEVFIWIMRSRSFPSGCWFEISAARISHEEPESVLFTLQSSIASLGDVVLPHLRKVFAGVSLSSANLSAHGLFTGKSIPSALNTGLPSAMPWISIRLQDYWKLCLCLISSDGQVQLF